MTSSAQKNAGYLLPDNLAGDGEICVKLRFPNTLEYRAAVRGQLMELGKWWTWEKSYQPGDTRATEAAAIFREFLHDELSFGDCGDCTMPEFRIFECALQVRLSEGETWQTVPGGENICGTDGADGTDGRTPELRSVEIGECNEHQWRYTDEGAGDWRSLGYVCDGQDGKDGQDGAGGGGGGKLGDIIATAREEIPAGCLPCDGSVQDRADYPELYDTIHPSLIIDSESFRTPDLRGRTIFGEDAGTGRVQENPSSGDTGGAGRVALDLSEMAPHQHDGYSSDTYSQFAIGGSGAAPDASGPYAGSFDTGFAGDGEPHENMPPYQSWKYYIVAIPDNNGAGALRAIRIGNCSRLEQLVGGTWQDIETWKRCDATYPKPPPPPPTTTEQIRCDLALGLLAWLEDMRAEVHAGLVAGDDRATLATRMSDMEWHIIGGGGRAYGYWLYFVDAILPFMTPAIWLSGLSDGELRGFATEYYCNLAVREDKTVDSTLAEQSLFDYLAGFPPESWVGIFFNQVLLNIGVPSFENAALVYDIEDGDCDFGCDEPSTPCAVVGKEVEAGGALCEIEDLGGGWVRIHAEYLSGYGFWRVAFATECCLVIDNAVLFNHQGTTSASMIAECDGLVHSLQPTTTNPIGWLIGKSLAPDPLPGNESYEFGMWLNGFNDFYLDVHLVSP